VGVDASATLGTVAQLNGTSSVGIGGTLTVTTVTAFDPGSTVDVVAGSTVNTFEFPGATSISGITATAFTIDSLTLPNGAFALSKDLIIAGGAELVIQDLSQLTGSGTILADNPGASISIDGTPGYTTTSTALAPAALATALAVLNADSVILEAGGGEVTVTNNSTAVGVEDTGSPITVTTGTTILVGSGVGTGATDGVTDFALIVLSINGSDELELVDGGYAGVTPKIPDVTFGSVKLVNNNLISPALAPFIVALTTSRS
jgi:hypothetical protein